MSCGYVDSQVDSPVAAQMMHRIRAGCYVIRVLYDDMHAIGVVITNLKHSAALLTSPRGRPKLSLVNHYLTVNCHKTGHQHAAALLDIDPSRPV